MAKLDAIVLATGYRAGVAALFPRSTVPVDEAACRRSSRDRGELAGVFFVGFDVRQAGGLLRTIGQQALSVATQIGAAPAHPRTP